jgi:hypothetical protein
MTVRTKKRPTSLQGRRRSQRRLTMPAKKPAKKAAKKKK